VPPSAPAYDPSAAAEARTAGGAYALPGMECLVSDVGIRVKVLPVEPGVRCVDRVPGGVLVGGQLRHFHPYFVFDVWPSAEDPEYYLLGSTPRRESTIGWAPGGSLVRWDTRVGARYARREGVRVPPLLVYEDPQALADILATGSTEQQPLARATLSADQTLMPWPIAESKQITVNGKVHELARIDFLGEFVEGADLAADPVEEIQAAEMYTQVEMARIQEGVRMLDIVFCMDNTHSTGDYLESMREAVRRISLEIDALPFRPDVSFGLVLYRDYVNGVYFESSEGPSVVRNYGLENDLTAFLQRVEPIREARESSIDWAEAGYDGLHEAITRTAWRGGGLSARCVVLIGDNSFHEPGNENKNPRGIGLEQIRREAAARGVKVFSLCVDGKGGNEEQRVHWEQSYAIAEATGGEGFRIEDALRVVDRVRGIMDVETDIVHTRAIVLDDLIEGVEPEQIAASKDLDVREVTEVMEFLGGAGVDLSKLGPGIPSFATGWVLTEISGVPIVDREVYVARPELDVLLAALNLLSSHLSPDFGRQVFGMGLQGRTDPLASFFAGEVPEPLDVFLMAKGIPVGRTSILRLPSAEIRHMSEESRGVLRDRITRQNVPMLVNVRNDDSLWTLRDEIEFGWIPERSLP
jgi:hypothetical protein